MTPTQADADTLYRRLEDGYQKIEKAQQEKRDTYFLDEFWLSLLREYQAVCDELRQADEQDKKRAQTAATQKGMNLCRGS